MRFPDKFTSYKDSIISKLPIILDKIQQNGFTALSLYTSIKRAFDNNVSEFLDALVCLYALNKIELNDGVITYVKND